MLHTYAVHTHCTNAILRLGRDMPLHTRAARVTVSAGDPRVIGPALGWGSLGRHLEPGQPLDINQEHIVLVLAGVIHASKDEQAVLRQHRAAVSCAGWQRLAILPCIMQPHAYGEKEEKEGKDEKEKRACKRCLML